MMNPKQEILQALFENNVFTGNFSELARRLGYTGRNTIARIKGGENMDRKCDLNELNIFDSSSFHILLLSDPKDLGLIKDSIV